MNYADAMPNGQLPRDRTPVAIKVDNLVRRSLRIGDPADASEVAEGLRRVFASGAHAADLEAKGLPQLSLAIFGPTPKTMDGGPTGADLDQAVDDIERDLKSLTTNSQLKDIEPELQGWAQAIRGIVADGVAGARIALDPRARDRAFAARRQLGDYARLARLVGAMSQSLSMSYRRLAQSLDEAAAVIIVIAGETIAGSGAGGGRFLLAMPASELQARRDSILNALRALNGAPQETYGNGQWPWGLHGLRELIRQIEASGHLDLRALLDENTMARGLDELLDRASTQNSRGLRALGATADVALQQLYRLLHVVDNRIDPQSPPVASLFKAIQLFLDAFAASDSGYRIPFAARSPLLLNGFRGLSGPDVPTITLLGLIHARGRLAELLDCYLGCGCCADEVFCQILLDKILYDTDRAIDLYMLGRDEAGRGEPEWRAAAYGVMIQEFDTNHGLRCLPDTAQPDTVASPGLLSEFPLSQLPSPPLSEDEETVDCIDPTTACGPVSRGACWPRIQELRDIVLGIRDLLAADKIPTFDPEISIHALSQGEAERFRSVMRDELCLQRLSDRRWINLVATMAPSCLPATDSLNEIDRLLRCALQRLSLRPGDCTDCAEPAISIPPTIETSFDGFVRGRPTEGL